jgi:hypothetical protein
MMVNVSRALDQSPAEVEQLHRLIIGVRHEKFPNATDAPQHELFHALEPTVRARIESSEAHKASLAAIVSRFEALPGSEKIGAKRRPHHHAIVVAVIAGLIIGAVIVGVIVIYLAVKYDD